jgi:hypothetical protein
MHSSPPAAGRPPHTVPLPQQSEPTPCTVPLAKRGKRPHARFPSRSGGNLKEGGQCMNFARAIWYYRQLRPQHLAPASEGEQHLQQVGIVHHAIAIHIGSGGACRPKLEQHR